MISFNIIEMNNSRFEKWTEKKVIDKLKSMGIKFEKNQFLKDVKSFYSAEDLSKHWREKFPIYIKDDWEDDFIWETALFLWEKFAPDIINTEKLDDMMQAGYDLIEKGNYSESFNLWFKVWEHLKKRFTPEMRSITDAEIVFLGMSQSLYNWCQDFESELLNAGLNDQSFFKKRIEYCNDFYNLFPATDDLIIVNMKRAIAESYFYLDDIQNGIDSFQKLINEFPDSAWGYIGFGDMYSHMGLIDSIPIDLKKAKKIYQTGLKKVKDSMERGYILERLENIEEIKKERDLTRKSGG